jgi:hypothetical protein
MTRLLLSLALLALLVTASSPLLCYKIGWDLRWHRARCWSTEFEVGPVQPTEAPTATPMAYTDTPEPEPSATPEPLPTATWSYPYPLPTMPTLNPYPYMEVNP